MELFDILVITIHPSIVILDLYVPGHILPISHDAFLKYFVKV
jgi:hypothetical protein